MDVAKRGDLARVLAEAGYDDVLVVSRGTGAQLLTQRRLDLLGYLRINDPVSERDLADTLDHEVQLVRDDLNLLLGHDIIEFDGDDRVRLKHDHVVVEPIV